MDCDCKQTADLLDFNFVGRLLDIWEAKQITHDIYISRVAV